MPDQNDAPNTPETDNQPGEPQNSHPMARRELLKALIATGGVMALSGLPGQWVKPVVEIGYLPAHAQASPAPAVCTNVLAYVTNNNSNNVSVIDTATNTVVATVAVGTQPFGVAVNPAGTRAYVTNNNSNNVSVIDTATNTVIATVAVGNNPNGVAVNPAGTRVYVTNYFSDNVSVIDTATNTVIATVAVGTHPFSLGNFIGTVAC